MTGLPFSARSFTVFPSCATAETSGTSAPTASSDDSVALGDALAAALGGVAEDAGRPAGTTAEAAVAGPGSLVAALQPVTNNTPKMHTDSRIIAATQTRRGQQAKRARTVTK